MAGIQGSRLLDMKALMESPLGSREQLRDALRRWKRGDCKWEFVEDPGEPIMGYVVVEIIEGDKWECGLQGIVWEKPGAWDWDVIDFTGETLGNGEMPATEDSGLAGSPFSAVGARWQCERAILAAIRCKLQMLDADYSETIFELTATMPLARTKNPAAVSLGRLGGLVGGNARAASLTPERRSEIAQNAAKSRWMEVGAHD